MKRKLALIFTLMISVAVVMAGCGQSGKNSNGKNKNFTVGMVTDSGGIDDRSFNQSAWEGLQKFGKENKLKKGTNGYNYVQSQSDADYFTNLNSLIRNKFNLVYGIGYKISDALAQVADRNPKTDFAIVDSVVSKPNVASITFKENEGSYLVGVVAGLMTKTNKIGFIGGAEGELIGKFEAGFRAGVKAVNPKAKVQVKYAGTFDNAAIGNTIASSMYASGNDIIYTAAGGTGLGVFTEAKNEKQRNPNKNIWVIGVDRDQYDQGIVKVKGKAQSITLTSMVKRVNIAVEDVSTKAMKGNFPGGKVVQYGLKENGVGISPSTQNIPKDILAKVDDWKQRIIDGKVVVPTSPKDVK